MMLRISLLIAFFISSHLAQAQSDSLKLVLKNQLALMQFDKALISLEEIYKQGKDEEYYLLNTASCFENLGQTKKAAELYEKLIALNDSHTIAKSKLAQLYKNKGLYRASLELYQNLIESDRSNSYYHKQRAYLALQLGNIQQGLFSYQDAITYNPEDIEAIFGLAKIYLEIRYYPATDSLVELALKLDPDHIPLRILAANSAYRQEKYATMKEHIEANFRISKDSSAYQLKLLGIANYHLGNYSQSIHCLKRMEIKEEPTELIYNSMGLAYFENGNHQESEASFSKALKLAISNKTGAYYSYLGLNQHILKEYNRAVESFKKSYEYKEDPLMFYYIARSYDENFADKKPAQKYYERFLAESPEKDSPFTTYSEERLSQFKTIEHFKEPK